MIRILLLLALAAAAAPAGAQARYLPQTDTLYYEALNPYRMYFMVRGDTVGDPVRSLNVERHVWRQSDGALTVEVRQDDVDGGQPPSKDVLEVSPRGVVTAIRQGEQDYRGRWDLVLRLPADGELRPGRVWHDTLRNHGGPGGKNAFEVWRELRVERIADTLGSRIAIVRGTGTLHYRDSYPSQAEKEWWIDVSGPMRETFLFDLTHGRMAGRAWWMDLRGTAAFPNGDGGMDTLPAGLFSADTTRLITAEQARAAAPDVIAALKPRRAQPPEDGGPLLRGRRLHVRPREEICAAAPCPRSLLRGDHLATRVAQIARSSCEGAGRALLYRLDEGPSRQPCKPPGGRDGTDTDAAA